MSIEYVIARYNEPWLWLTNPFIHDYKLTLYNKGYPVSIPYIELKNVGRESHTYLHHIINNYDKLSEITVFSQGNISDHVGHANFKFNCFTNIDLSVFDFMIEDAKRYGNSMNYRVANMPRNFNIINKDDLVKNYACDPDHVDKITFADWFETNIKVKYPEPLNLFLGGIFVIRKDKILSRPKSYYENLIKHVEYTNAPLEGHFFERSWFYIFNCTEKK